MRLLTIHFEKPVTNPSKLGGVHQTTFSAPMDIQVHESGRVTLTAPDGTVAIVHGVGFHGVPSRLEKAPESAVGVRFAQERQDLLNDAVVRDEKKRGKKS